MSRIATSLARWPEARLGIVEKIVLDDETLMAVQERAQCTGHSIDGEVAGLVRLALQVEAARASLIKRSRVLRASMPVQTTDSLTFLREDRDR